MNIYCFSTLSFAKLQFKSVINKAFHKHGVASFTDAWIETVTLNTLLTSPGVASFTDAWIETALTAPQQGIAPVASFTDAWIETLWELSQSAKRRSHLLQMRGLKPKLSNDYMFSYRRIFYRCVD